MEKILSPFNFNQATLQSPVGDSPLPRGFNNDLSQENTEVIDKINAALENLRNMAEEINKKTGKLFIDHQRAKEQFTRLTYQLLRDYERRKTFYQNN